MHIALTLVIIGLAVSCKATYASPESSYEQHQRTPNPIKRAFAGMSPFSFCSNGIGGSKLNLTCETFSLFVITKIDYACAASAGGVLKACPAVGEETNCTGQDLRTSAVLQNACLYKPKCTFVAPGDINEEVALRATCSFPPDFTPVPTPASVCATTSSGNSLELSCPTGLVIGDVTFAEYGTPTGSCNNSSLTGATCINCSRDPLCTLDVTRQVLRQCLGDQSCTIDVSPSALGLDPCPNSPILKRAIVDAVCVSSAPTPIPAPVDRKDTVAILGSSIGYSPNSMEARVARLLGFFVEYLSLDDWAANGIQEFESYAAVVVGDDATCQQGGPYPSAMMPRVSGNIVMTGLPLGYGSRKVYDDVSISPGLNSLKLLINALRIVTATNTSAGLYVSLGCVSSLEEAQDSLKPLFDGGQPPTLSNTNAGSTVSVVTVNSSQGVEYSSSFDGGFFDDVALLSGTAEVNGPQSIIFSKKDNEAFKVVAFVEPDNMDAILLKLVHPVPPPTLGTFPVNPGEVLLNALKDIDELVNASDWLVLLALEVDVAREDIGRIDLPGTLAEYLEIDTNRGQLTDVAILLSVVVEREECLTTSKMCPTVAFLMFSLRSPYGRGEYITRWNAAQVFKYLTDGAYYVSDRVPVDNWRMQDQKVTNNLGPSPPPAPIIRPTPVAGSSTTPSLTSLNVGLIVGIGILGFAIGAIIIALLIVRKHRRNPLYVRDLFRPNELRLRIDQDQDTPGDQYGDDSTHQQRHSTRLSATGPTTSSLLAHDESIIGLGPPRPGSYSADDVIADRYPVTSSAVRTSRKVLPPIKQQNPPLSSKNREGLLSGIPSTFV